MTAKQRLNVLVVDRDESTVAGLKDFLIEEGYQPHFLTEPDAVVYLGRRRGARLLPPKYLAELIDAYNHYYHHYDRAPVLVVDTRDLNFPDRSSDFEELVDQLKRPQRGTHYYMPRGVR